MPNGRRGGSKNGRLAGKCVAFAGRLDFGNRGLASLQKLVAEEGGTLVDDPLKSPPDYLVAGYGVAGGPPAIVAKVQKKHPRTTVIDRNQFYKLVLPTPEEFVELLFGGRNDADELQKARERFRISGIRLDLTIASFRGRGLTGDFQMADVDGVDFRGSQLSVDFGEVKGAKFDGAALNSGTLSKAADCSFKRATMRDVRWNPGSFVRCDFTDAVLCIPMGSYTGAVDCVFRNADFRGSDLGGSRFPTADFRGANLTEVKLEKCDFTGADLQGADLTGADLRNAVFKNADLRKAKFKNAVLIEADFGGAKVDGADFADAVVTDAVFAGVDLSKTKGLVLRTLRTPGLNLLKLAEAAEDSDRFETSIELRLGPQESAKLIAALRRRDARIQAIGCYSRSRAKGSDSGNVSVQTILQAMQKLADAWSRGEPDFRTVKVEAKKCPLRGNELQDLAVAAWHEAYGLEPPSAGDFQKAAKARAADAASLRRTVAAETSSLREILLEELKGGAKGVKAWNARPARERAMIGGLRNQDFKGAMLTGADFSERDLAGSTFAGATLNAARFRDSLLKGVDFSKANVAGAYFVGSKPTEASFEGARAVGCNMGGTSFLRCNFRHADLTKADFFEADLRGADFTDATLKGTQFLCAKYDERTVFPSGFNRRGDLVWKGAGPDPGIPASPAE